MRKQFITFSFMLIALAIIVAGCGQGKKPQPVAINEEVDVCEVCSMMVMDNEHATQLILKNGRALKFDDLGDLFVWTDQHGMDDVSVRYVRDYHTMEWVDLEEAFYVYDASFSTPMGYGVYSFKSKEDAEALIAEEHTGTFMTASDLAAHSWESTMGHGDHHGHGDHGHGHGEAHGQEHGELHDHGEHVDHGEHADHGDHEDHDHESGEHVDTHQQHGHN